ncbi:MULTISPECIES: hypothetical protein [unclassified Streptomyces]|uniref:hypothetical protein n=1 Tax=unclassified Streptomyces TaxID=2593676 RepID=UPI000A8BC14C|nr:MULTISPECIES: hypothetical protein [unclassified Streptomyces]
MLRTRLTRAAAVSTLAAFTAVLAGHTGADRYTRTTATTVWETAPVGKFTTVWE